jgi:hypothetical protein
VSFLPDEKGVEQLARQIKITGRAYPLFQIAQLVLQKPERYSVQLGVKKKNDGTVAQALFVCALDDSPWLSEDEAVAHVLKHHFATFYQAERTATEPPKGTYTFVAQCGMSGVILGPPNYHDYQNQLRKLHAERFSRMPFDVFKARVKIVKDEAVVKKWIDDLSFKTEYNCLNVPSRSSSRPWKRWKSISAPRTRTASSKPVEILHRRRSAEPQLAQHRIATPRARRVGTPETFPLPTVATKLSQQFASHGLQFFKVNKTVTHVAVARPQFLDLETTPVSENIKRIVEFINANAKCTRKKLVEALAPSLKPTVIEVKPEGGTALAAEVGPTAEQTAVISDLHWLVHQGHVLEFADGRLETAKKPAPRPAKPEKKTAEVKAEQVLPPTEVAATPVSEIPALVESATPASSTGPVVPPVVAAESDPTPPAAPPNQIASEPPVS